MSVRKVADPARERTLVVLSPTICVGCPGDAGDWAVYQMTVEDLPPGLAPWSDEAAIHVAQHGYKVDESVARALFWQTPGLCKLRYRK